jgi:hypothetical protein
MLRIVEPAEAEPRSLDILDADRVLLAVAAIESDPVGPVDGDHVVPSPKEGVGVVAIQGETAVGIDPKLKSGVLVFFDPGSGDRPPKGRIGPMPKGSLSLLYLQYRRCGRHLVLRPGLAYDPAFPVILTEP